MIWAFFVLVMLGIVLLGFEIFVPGGLLGIIGFVALTSAIVIAFTSINTTAGIISIIGTFVIFMIYMYLWVAVFPKTRLGKRFELSENVEGSGTEDGSNLLDQIGEAVTDLRPGGFASINGRRVDVVAASGFINVGEPIKVIKAVGNNITVLRHS